MSILTAIVALLTCSCALAIPITPSTNPDPNQGNHAIVKGVSNDFGGASLPNLEMLATPATEDTMTLNGGLGTERASKEDGRLVRKSKAGFFGGLLTGMVNMAIGAVVVVLKIAAFGKKKQQ